MRLTPQIHLFRPAPKPSADIPLGARSVGYYDMMPYVRETWTAPDVSKLFWCVFGSGELRFGSTVRTLKAGQIALYLPYAEHDITSHEEWKYWWITVDGPIAVSMLKGFGLDAGVFEAGDAPVALFRELEQKIGNFTRYGERTAGAVAYHIISLAAASGTDYTDKLMAQAVALIEAEWDNPDLDVMYLAKKLQVHRSTLCRHFKDTAGMSPVKYIMNQRMRHALELLKTERDQIEQIAFRCGFSSGNYFSRMVKRVTGMTPQELRDGLVTG